MLIITVCFLQLLQDITRHHYRSIDCFDNSFYHLIFSGLNWWIDQNNPFQQVPIIRTIKEKPVRKVARIILTHQVSGNTVPGRWSKIQWKQNCEKIESLTFDWNLELMNPKFCIQIVSTLYPWDKIGTKLGQCFFGPNRAWLSVLSIVLDSYYLELVNKFFKNVLLCSWFMEWTKMNEN